MEMIATEDWIVPRQQGDPYFASARPPLQSWVMAELGLLRGKVDALAVRLPSAVSILLITLLVYGYSNTFLSPAGAFSAGAAYATMGQVMELGRLGETDAMFALFVSGSLLLWHWGVSRQWKPAITWGLAWLCVALATLTKGLQAPVYFVLSVSVYLVVTRRWRFALSWANVFGILVFAMVWGSWQFPFYLKMGMKGTHHIYGGDVSIYLRNWGLASILKHYPTYPIEMFGCLLPWSVFLLAFTRREIRRTIRPINQNLLFMLISLAVTFPSVWLIPGTETRFYVSLYPCIAVLVGIVIDQCMQAEAGRVVWKQFLTGFALLFSVAGPVVLVGSFFMPGTAYISQPGTFAVGFAISTALLAAVAWWARSGQSELRAIGGVLSIAAFAGLLYAGVAVNYLISKSENAAEAVSELKNKLPRDVQLVSYGPIHHLFAYHYGKPIRKLPNPASVQTKDGVTYFSSLTEPMFPYEELARIVCDRNRSPHPERVVIVGRRIYKNQK
jgi:4-amino-4-deoxy-L-arabinose transferase-like glycosyltransferase